MTSARTPMIVLLIVLGLSGFLTLWLNARNSAGIDFYQMWVGARIAPQARAFYAAATGARMGEEYFRRAAIEERSARRLAVARHRRQLELVSTPFLYTMYAPLRGTYERDLLLFQILSFASLTGAIALFARAFRLGLILGLGFFAFIVNAFEPVASDLRVANVNSIVLLLIACTAALLAKKQFTASGLMLAFAALTKPYVILVFPLMYGLWMLKRRWRDFAAHAAGAAFAAVVAFVASSLYFRSWSIWMEWARALRAMPATMIPLEIGNIAFVRIAQELWGVNASTIILIVATALAIVAGWRSQATSEHLDRLALSLGCIIALLGSPLVWVHYLVSSIPLLALLLRPAETNRAPRQIVAAIALAIVAIDPWAQLIPTMTQVAVIANGGLLLAFVAGLLDFHTRDAA